MVIDEHVRTYRTGGCFALAEALRRITGFPVRCIDFGSCVHAFVVSPANEVLDIHGLTPWVQFLDFLVAERCLPPHAVEQGLVQHHAIAELEDSLLWREQGYKRPSETAVRRARAVALKHPNLASHLADKSSAA